MSSSVTKYQKSEVPTAFDYSKFQIRKTKVNHYQLGPTISLSECGGIEVTNADQQAVKIFVCTLKLDRLLLTHSPIECGYQVDIYANNDAPCLSLEFTQGDWFVIEIVPRRIKGEVQTPPETPKTTPTKINSFEVFGIRYKLLFNEGNITDTGLNEYEVTLDSGVVRPFQMWPGWPSPFEIGDRVKTIILAPFGSKVGRIYMVSRQCEAARANVPSLLPIKNWILDSIEFWKHHRRTKNLRNKELVRNFLMTNASDREFKPLPPHQDQMHDSIFHIWFEIYHAACRSTNMSRDNSIAVAKSAATGAVQDIINLELYDSENFWGRKPKYSPKTSLCVPVCVD